MRGSLPPWYMITFPPFFKKFAIRYGSSELADRDRWRSSASVESGITDPDADIVSGQSLLTSNASLNSTKALMLESRDPHISGPASRLPHGSAAVGVPAGVLSASAVK